MSISHLELRAVIDAASSKVRGLIDDMPLEERMLEKLKGDSPEWTPARTLSGISLQYCARIAKLRRRGYVIENKVIVRDGVRLGFYRLAPPKAPAKAAPIADSQGSLFRDAVAYRDPEEAVLR